MALSYARLLQQMHVGCVHGCACRDQHAHAATNMLCRAQVCLLAQVTREQEKKGCLMWMGLGICTSPV